MQWNVFEGQKVGRLKYRFRASKAQDEMKKKQVRKKKETPNLKENLSQQIDFNSAILLIHVWERMVCFHRWERNFKRSFQLQT